jgi:amino acid transporter
LNYRGIDIVGKVAIGICTISMIPFALFCILGASKVDPKRWLDQPEGGFWGVDWRLLLNTFFWNINFWVSLTLL